MRKPLGIVTLCRFADDVARAECAKAGIPFQTPLQVWMASGLDVALTLMEGSGARYQGLSREQALSVVAYFKAEAERIRSVDQRLAIWYLAWASVIEAESVAGGEAASE